MALPCITAAKQLNKSESAKRLLIVSEGFEKRSLYWISKQNCDILFTRSLICNYSPKERSYYDKLYGEVEKRTYNKQIFELSFNRFDPTPFEVAFEEKLTELLIEITEIVIDISAMSKMLIMIILHSLKDCHVMIRIIYSEPCSWSPSEAEFRKRESELEDGSFVSLSSVGVFNVVRTPGLSSIIMQDSPSLLIAFTSTNGHLIHAVANEITPALSLLINAKNVREPWREQAALDIQKNYINDFPMYSNNIPSFELMDYIGVFNYLATIYRQNCYNNRIIISPTGSKIHTIACVLLKNCCADIHIEYPAPESYLIDAYSSDDVFSVHEIDFLDFSGLIQDIVRHYRLNG